MENKEFKKRETKSTYSINGRNFQINSYDPMVGNYILMQIVSQVMPMGLGRMLNQEFGTESIPSVGSEAMPMMSKRDFIQLQVDILSTVYELYDTGEKSPVVRENGTYGVADVNMMMIMKKSPREASFIKTPKTMIKISMKTMKTITQHL